MRKVKVFLLSMFALLVLTACGKTALDTTSDLTVEFTGANGYGQASITSIDPWATTIYKNEQNNSDAMQKVAEIGQYITYSLAEDYLNLSNGDTVIVNVDVNSDALKNLGYSAKSETKEFKVEGLSDAIIIDAFENIEIPIKGFDGNASISGIPTEDIQGIRVDYAVDKANSISVGDVITVTASISGGNAGEYLLKEDTYSFKVEKLDSYITKVAELPEKLIADINAQSADIRTAENASDSNNNLGSIDYKGAIIMTRKGDVVKGSELYMVYETSFSADELDTQSYYWVVRYNNPIKSADGSANIELTSGSRYGNSAKFTNANNKNYYVTGYNSIADLKTDIIDRNAANYSSDTNL